MLLPSVFNQYSAFVKWKHVNQALLYYTKHENEVITSCYTCLIPPWWQVIQDLFVHHYPDYTILALCVARVSEIPPHWINCASALSDPWWLQFGSLPVDATCVITAVLGLVEPRCDSCLWLALLTETPQKPRRQASTVWFWEPALSRKDTVCCIGEGQLR